jgi:probable rRNA maturation factor
MRVARFFNRQRTVALERTLLRRLVRSLLEECLGRADYQLGVHFIGATEMARLNESFLGHQGSTDVITFDHQERDQTGALLLWGAHAPRVQGSAPSLNPRAEVSDEGVADDTRGACAPRKSCSGAPALKLRRHPQSEPLYGEIFISIDDALIYASRFRVPWQSEVARYLVHGVLHLEGFDDTDPAARRVMKRRENRLLKELSARFDLAKMDRKCR